MNRLLESLALRGNEALRKHTGFCLRRLPVSLDDLRLHLIRRHNIDLIVDGGANKGQWGTRLLTSMNTTKEVGFSSSTHPTIVSIEPSSEAFAVLLKKANQEQKWVALQCALGAENAEGMLNMALNEGQSSSLRQPKEHLTSYSTVDFAGAESVTIRRLDEIPEVSHGKAIWLKLDIQGFEREAILGAERIMSSVKAIEIETSFREMYEGQSSHLELLSLLDELGFSISRYSDPATDHNGEMLYLDVIATRSQR